jgi:hypothetical protein
MARAAEDFDSMSEFMRYHLDSFGMLAHDDKSEQFQEDRAE